VPCQSRPCAQRRGVFRAPWRTAARHNAWKLPHAIRGARELLAQQHRAQNKALHRRALPLHSKGQCRCTFFKFPESAPASINTYFLIQPWSPPFSPPKKRGRAGGRSGRAAARQNASKLPHAIRAQTKTVTRVFS